jgi:hypothetical protein
LERWTEVGDNVVKLFVATDDSVFVDDSVRVKESLVSENRVLDALLKTAFY